MSTKAAGFLIYRIVQSQIEYLLMKASYGKFHWTPPKGHVDPGEEDLYTTALRETCEEAGYAEDDLIIYKDLSKTLQYQVKGKPKETTYWLAQLKDPLKLPTLSHEHTDFKFLKKDEAAEISGYADFTKMLNFFEEEIKKIHQLA